MRYPRAWIPLVLAVRDCQVLNSICHGLIKQVGAFITQMVLLALSFGIGFAESVL